MGMAKGMGQDEKTGGGMQPWTTGSDIESIRLVVLEKMRNAYYSINYI